MIRGDFICEGVYGPYRHTKYTDAYARTRRTHERVGPKDVPVRGNGALCVHTDIAEGGCRGVGVVRIRIRKGKKQYFLTYYRKMFAKIMGGEGALKFPVEEK